MNEIVTPKWLTREIVEQFDRDLKLLTDMERRALYVDPSAIRVRLPQRFVVREGQQMDPQPIAEETVLVPAKRYKAERYKAQREQFSEEAFAAVKFESDEDETTYVAKAPQEPQRLDVLYGIGVLGAGRTPQAAPKPERKRAEIIRPVLRTFSADVEE